jgi:hypothetical protein
MDSSLTLEDFDWLRKIEAATAGVLQLNQAVAPDYLLNREFVRLPRPRFAFVRPQPSGSPLHLRSEPRLSGGEFCFPGRH